MADLGTISLAELEAMERQGSYQRLRWEAACAALSGMNLSPDSLTRPVPATAAYDALRYADALLEEFGRG